MLWATVGIMVGEGVGSWWMGSVLNATAITRARVMAEGVEGAHTTTETDTPVSY